MKQVYENQSVQQQSEQPKQTEKPKQTEQSKQRKISFFRQFVKSFATYCIDRRRVIGLYLTWNLLTIVLLILYQVPIQAIYYCVFLPLFVTLFIGVYDYVNVIKKQGQIFRMNEFHGIALKSIDTANHIEVLYLEKLYELDQKCRSLEIFYEQNRSDLSDYYTHWSHQIKTPLAAIKLLLEEKEKVNIPLLSQELLKIESYVESALYYVRLQTISSDCTFMHVELNLLIRQVLKKYATFFIYKNISLEYEMDETYVLTDEKWLAFVIEQILSNALKYTRNGKIKISYEKEEQQLSIEDTGIGIREEDIHRVFDKGFTGYNGRMDKQSTGIGLYLTKKILDHLRHGILIESTVNVGTKVSISLKRDHLESE